MNPVAARTGEPRSFLWTPRRSGARWLVAFGALTAGLAHIPVIAPHLAEAPYMGEEFIVLTAACLLLVVAVLVCDSSAIYALALLTGVLALAGYITTRLIAFPQLSDDVGDWFEPLGIVSITAEALMAAAAGWALIRTSATVPGDAGGSDTTAVATRAASPAEGFVDGAADTLPLPTIPLLPPLPPLPPLPVLAAERPSQAHRADDEW